MADAPSAAHADIELPQVVSPAEWRASFEEPLTKAKAITAARDEMSAARRRMPMMRVDADYRFVGPGGEVGLLDLFEGRRQLIVYRFYEAMGAQWYAAKPTAEPTWTVQMYRFTLPR